MQYKILHEAADIDDARKMDIADRRQFFIYPRAGAERPLHDLDRSDARRLAKAGVNADNKRVGESPVYEFERVFEIHGMNGFIERPE
ncbi:hypothetical protein HMSSN036_06220 [Paenibacillus macerans]|nr:hypothetical protein HMSSN036_06220 [Paenibacillus macerans]